MKNSTLRITIQAFTLCAFVLICPKVYSQQDPLYALYMNNPLLINPAYSGINNNLTAFAGIRNQWGGFDGSPTTLNAGGHASLWKNKMAAGMVVVSDKIGENTNTQLTGTYAYKLPIAPGQTLSFGMQAGFVNYKVDPSQLTLQDYTDPLFAPVNQMKPTLGAGVMWKGDRFLVGLSVPRLINSTFDMGGQKTDVYQRHYYLLGSYIWFISERIMLKPSVLLKAYSGAPLSADLNFNIIFHRTLTAGVYTRNFNSYGLLAQLDFLEKFRVAYAFEVPTNQSVGARFVTNEIMVSIRTAVFGFHEGSSSVF